MHMYSFSLGPNQLCAGENVTLGQKGKEMMRKGWKGKC